MKDDEGDEGAKENSVACCCCIGLIMH